MLFFGTFVRLFIYYRPNLLNGTTILELLTLSTVYLRRPIYFADFFSLWLSCLCSRNYFVTNSNNSNNITCFCVLDAQNYQLNVVRLI